MRLELRDQIGGIGLSDGAHAAGDELHGPVELGVPAEQGHVRRHVCLRHVPRHGTPRSRIRPITGSWNRAAS